jgi:hypothetical protein
MSSALPSATHLSPNRSGHALAHPFDPVDPWEDPGVLQRLESLRHGRSGAMDGLGDQLIAL